MFPQTSQSPAVSDIDVMSLAIELTIETAEALGITLDINSPTFPLAALLFVVVPIIPPVDGLNTMLVAVAAPKVGVISVGDVCNKTLPVPDGVPSPRFTKEVATLATSDKLLAFCKNEVG